jgi:glycine hydroxymethyltransferase
MSAKTPRQYYDEVLGALQEHHQVFNRYLPLIASENVPSPAVREALTTDFGNRYAEGWVGERVYAGCEYIDRVESVCIDLLKQLFKAEFIDPRPVSGVLSNLIVYTAFTQPGNTIMALPIACGGHITYGRKNMGGTAGAVSNLEVEYLPLDYDELNIDVDKTRNRLGKLVNGGRAPKLVVFGGSVFPFPHPVKELEGAFHDAGAIIHYDSAHVSGLIAAGKFQDPLREGVDTITVSTHKTFFGPQHGVVVSWERYSESIKKATLPGLVSNHHLHALAGVAIASAELLQFGEDYATQVIKNSKALGQALYERGFKVLAEHKGFTESHMLLIDITEHGDGGSVEKQLEKAGIIVNRNLLPWDIKEGRHYTNPGGIRLGTSELTRLGMKQHEMNEVAELMKRVIVNGENPRQVSIDVAELRSGFEKVHYCFENATKAYEYVKIR